MHISQHDADLIGNILVIAMLVGFILLLVGGNGGDDDDDRGGDGYQLVDA